MPRYSHRPALCIVVGQNLKPLTFITQLLLCSSKMKEFAGNSFKFDEIHGNFLQMVDNTGKRRNFSSSHSAVNKHKL